MSKRLTENDRRLWAKVTKTIRMLGSAPVSPAKGQLAPLASAPRDNGFNPILDLHGLTIQQAYEAVAEHLYKAKLAKHRRLTVITGRSGPMNLEFPRWLENRSEITSVNSTNGGGAWQIWLKKDI